mmetsp:Transcript_26985/g.77422  ORF Transcript_26985/g.77422 Transcript_26985/m.77422 type:complete len:492 (-) Transcript_26985:90-1565(-)
MTNSCQICGGRRSRFLPCGALGRAAALLAAGHLAAAAGAASDEVQSGGSLRGSSGSLFRQTPSVLVPQANDTISEDYWARVNRAISAEAQHTSPLPTLNDPLTTPTPEPWKKIMSASNQVNTLDASQAQNVISDWEYATPQPWSETGQPSERGQKQMSVVPYDMQIGARILYSLTAKTPQTPPPTQEVVDEAFMAQCPLIMFRGAIEIRPPRCQDVGSWRVPSTDRAVLRWNDDNKGGLVFGVDSAVTGQGSVKFAEIRERFSMSKYNFELLNCMDVMRYKIEEKIVKVNHMAPMARSTVREHDISRSSEAYFYKYILKHTNGSTAAETNLYRMDQSEVNFTLYAGEGGVGATFAVARRQGYWHRDQWRDCKHSRRAWTLEFPLAESHFATVATVQDLRVAAAATVTLMAFRDERVGSDGFSHAGQGHMYVTLVKTILFIVLALMLTGICYIALIQQGLDKRLRWFCFRLETVLLPKRPVRQRNPVLHPAY